MLYAKTVSPLSDRWDFETHLKYISVLSKLANGLSVSCTSAPALGVADLPKIKDKMRLIELTKQSIIDEHGIVQLDKDYSTAAVLWLPIKSYYLAYHLLCVIDYILTSKSTLLRAKHWECVDHFTKMLANGSLQFSEPLLNQVFDRSILNFRTAQGEILRKNVPDDVVYKAIMRKIANEKIVGFKLSKGITHTRTAVNRKEVEKYMQTMTVSIFDFFYQMRLRLNYRNFDFVDNVPADQTKAYFDGYFTTAGHFFKCFSNLRNKLVTDISIGTTS